MDVEMDIKEYLKQHEKKDLLRLLTCGSVDDGKSTLIGRLLFDTQQIYEDQLASVKKDSKIFGTTGDDFDPALLTDGLKAEREQGITIDVAYRYFSTAKRKFIIADTPGHEQYTRNMATGASNCELAIILIDARNGITTQTKRHSFIVSLLGIRHVIVAINKMDVLNYSEEKFEKIKTDYLDFIPRLDFSDISIVPMSALQGDNVAYHSPNMPWYKGQCLLDILESLTISTDRNLVDMRFPVQYVIRPHQDFRGFAGQMASGVITKGMEIVSLPTKKRSRVKSIVTFDKEIQEAFAPMSVVVTLEDEIDVSRGSILVPPRNVPHRSDVLDAMLIWMDDQQEAKATNSYTLKHATSSINSHISEIVYKVNVNTLKQSQCDFLKMNDIARVKIDLHRDLFFDSYKKNKHMGSFVLVDKMTNATVAAGMIIDRTEVSQLSSLGKIKSRNISEEKSLVDFKQRMTHERGRPKTFWMTGLSGSGKSTLAKHFEKHLISKKQSCFVLDGDNLRFGLNKDLGFSESDRAENIRRAAHVASLMNQAGVTVVCSFISPFAKDREVAKEIVGPENFIEVYLSTPLVECEKRDRKGLYQKARAGEIQGFTGIDSPYESPSHPDIILDTSDLSIEKCIELLEKNL